MIGRDHTKMRRKRIKFLSLKITMNNTIAFDINNNSYFNPGCADELRKMATDCTEFKAQVLSTMSTRFTIAVIILVSLIILRFILQYSNYSDTEMGKFIIKRIDWALIVTALCTIAIMFL